jgi:hypothetical protein
MRGNILNVLLKEMESSNFQVHSCNPHSNISLELDNDNCSFLEERGQKERNLPFVTSGARALPGNILRALWWASYQHLQDTPFQ